MEAFRKDVVFATRQLVKSPVFALVAVLTLALGIGANTAVFSVMNAVLLRSLPVRDPHGLYYVHMADGQGQPDGASSTGDANSAFSLPVFDALRRQHRIFKSLIAYAPLGEPKEALLFRHTPLEAAGDEVSGDSSLRLQPGSIWAVRYAFRTRYSIPL